MHTNDTVIPASTEQTPVDKGVFDINRFNRTPEARWRANKHAGTQSDNRSASVDDALSNAYRQFEPQQSTAESMALGPEEMTQVIQRVIQTNQLLEWMRREKMGGAN